MSGRGRNQDDRDFRRYKLTGLRLHRNTQSPRFIEDIESLSEKQKLHLFEQIYGSQETRIYTLKFCDVHSHSSLLIGGFCLYHSFP